MASDVDIRLKAEVNGFKSAMRTAQQSVKTLDAELKLNAAQMKASGESEELMAERAELLQKKIAEQEKAVEANTKALEAMRKQGKENTDEYRRMQTTLATSKTRLVETQGALKGLGDEFNKTDGEAKGFMKTLENISKNTSFTAIKDGISGITDVARTAFGAMKSLATGVWDLGVAGGEYADMINTWEESFGISRDTIQRMYAAGNAGFDVGAEQILDSINKMMNALRNGKVDIPFDIEQDKLVTFFQILDTLQKLEEEGGRNASDAYANEIFGKSYSDLYPLIVVGAEGYNKILAEQNVLTDEQMDNLQGVDDAVQQLNQDYANLKLDFAASIAEPMETISGALSGLIETLDKWVTSEEGQAALENLGNAVAGLFDGLTEDTFTSLLNGAVNVLNGITDAFKWIKENKGLAVGAVKALAIAFGGFKVTEGITSVMQLVNGLTGLSSAGGLAGAIGSLGVALAGAAITIGTATIIAQNADKWIEKAYNENPETALDKGINTWLENAYESLGYGDLQTKKIGDILKTKKITPITTGVYAYNAETGEQRELTQDEVEAIQELTTATEELTEVTKEKNGALPYNSYEEWLADTTSKIDNGQMFPLTIPTGKKGAPVQVDPESYYDYWFDKMGFDAWRDIFGINAPTEDAWGVSSGDNAFAAFSGEAITESLFDGIEENLETVEDAGYQVGAACAAGFIQGVTSAMSGFSLNGGSSTNNFNMGNVTFNNGLDIDGLAQKFAQYQYNARKGFGG